MKTPRSSKTGRFTSDWTEEELKQIAKWKKEGVPRWKIINNLVELRDGNIHHKTAYRLMDRLENK